MRTFLTALLFLFSLFAQAEIVDTYQFKNQADRTRAVQLAKSLRCPQCQNQNLVESNSPIAYDLRIEVYNMVNEGKTNQQIIDTMKARFGDFVNYKPPFQWNTALLWLLPIGLLILAFGLIWYSRQRTSRLEDNTSLSAFNNLEQVEQNTHFPQKSNGKIMLCIFALLLAIPLSYYLSLDRFSRLQEGKQAMISQHNKQIEMADFHKKEDVISKIQDKLRANPNNDEAWIQLGEAYVQNNEFDHALIAYANAEKLSGSKPNILGLKATALYYQAGQRLTPEIQQLLTQALEQDKKEVSSISLLATIELEQRNYSQAKNYLQQLLDTGNAAVDRRMVIQRMKMLEFLDRGQTQ
ncbi:nitrite reductase [Rodentibacter caecimuris]|uniref:Formate-dependent nitrite reductase complex subunit n=1 Tax=Rodentibacter caecimuris TaxID=1796644 RepID=A0A9X8VZB7_9PAST|nr:MULTISPECIES: heme lyase NrfEFG subunit NrfF [Pasteurellaceae]AOF52676.1 Cytochrome c-type heme lyase subunit nrfF, nitrite reductase complex assembly [Pasteurellaceae bacterium NI1060]MCR1837291.1 heme lyase NrfEFG subunit NrfF [Pasteurella caecimuris]MCU0106206.1 heme lyase NrfEFG subunit NrfF [Pasteurella caecimuris]OOF71923.1 nitrite reductase [Rodentibacter heylii]OOF76387.1 nitrite reductase [Rodentibacter heylii]